MVSRTFPNCGEMNSRWHDFRRERRHFNRSPGLVAPIALH
jgi:hypothetical protein